MISARVVHIVKAWYACKVFSFTIDRQIQIVAFAEQSKSKYLIVSNIEFNSYSSLLLVCKFLRKPVEWWSEAGKPHLDKPFQLFLIISVLKIDLINTKSNFI